MFRNGVHGYRSNQSLGGAHRSTTYERFPEEARQEAGFQLGRLQEGEEADDWKPMTTVGAGTIEIRIHTGTEHRVFVVTKFADRIHVLHAFEKKSQKTPQRDIDLAKRRYGQMIQEERKK